MDEHRYLAGSERMHFSNPYARAKAVGALHMAQTVAGIDAAACFRLKELEAIALTSAAGQEVMSAAARGWQTRAR